MKDFKFAFRRLVKNHQLKRLLLVSLCLTCMRGAGAFGVNTIVPDLKQAAHGIGAKFSSGTIARWGTDVKGREALFVRGDIWLDGVTFTDGVIECDILGKSAPRGSNFPGIAFRGADDSTFDSVYFRPFNFRAESPERASHAVQYISLPLWTWPKLRAEKTGQYEKAIVPPPDGDSWFHVKIGVEGKRVRVFINDAAKPCLEIETLNDRASGRIGISAGGNPGEGAYFANLKISAGAK